MGHCLRVPTSYQESRALHPVGHWLQLIWIEFTTSHLNPLRRDPSYSVTNIVKEFLALSIVKIYREYRTRVQTMTAWEKHKTKGKKGTCLERMNTWDGREMTEQDKKIKSKRSTAVWNEKKQCRLEDQERLRYQDATDSFVMENRTIWRTQQGEKKREKEKEKDQDWSIC